MENKNKNKIYLALKLVLIAIYAIICIFLITISFVSSFLFENWSGLLPDEIIYHIMAPLKGTDSGLIIKGLSTHGSMIVVSVILFAFFNVIVFKIKKGFKETVALTLCFSIFLCFSAVYEANLESGIADYAMDIVALNNGEEDFITKNYVDPSTIDIKSPEKKKNLIYIYLESFEASFSDKKNGGAFARDVIPEMTKIIEENECFNGEENIVNGAYSLPGTNWTAAGMFSEVSGLPIKLSLMDNDFMTEDSFLPKIETLGDILENNGYRNIISMGSDISFGGRNYLFKEHGNYEFRDYNYAIESGRLPSDYRVFWGYEDGKLFQFAKEDLVELSKDDRPFCYTMLTVDTHFEDGFWCPDCPDRFEDQYSNVYGCSSRKIDDFLSWFKTTDFYEDTVVVLAGDHLTMDIKYNSKLDKEYQRKVVYTVINSEQKPELDKYREYSVFDIFPTTLASLGFEISGNRLGLGTNLYSAEDTLTESVGYEKLKDYMEKPSNFYKQFFDDSILDRVEDINDRTTIVLEKDGNGQLMISLFDVSYFDPMLIEDVYIMVYEDEDSNGKRYDLNIFEHDRNKNQVGFFRAFTDILVPDEGIDARIEGYISYDGIEDILFVNKPAKLELEK